MQEGEPRHAVKKCHNRGTRIEALLVHPPDLQRTTGDLKNRGCLTLGEALGLEIAILGKQVHAFEALPALVTISVVSLRLLDDYAHSYLLFHPSPEYRDG
jgi:hypothetical protein